VFLSAESLPSADSADGSVPPLFPQFDDTTLSSEFPLAFMPALLWSYRTTADDFLQQTVGTSRSRAWSIRYMLQVFDSAVSDACEPLVARIDFAFRSLNSVGTRNESDQ
jgi:hypothetical protein